MILSISDQIGPGHAGMAWQTEQYYGPIQRYLWAGELEIRGGRIYAANPTSGMLARRVGGSAGNRVENLQKAVQKYAPAWVAPHAVFKSYSSETEHLSADYSGLQSAIRTVEDMPGNFRHDLLSAVHRVNMAVDLLLTAPESVTPGMRSEILYSADQLTAVKIYLTRHNRALLERVVLPQNPRRLLTLILYGHRSTHELEPYQKGLHELERALVRMTDSHRLGGVDFYLLK